MKRVILPLIFIALIFSGCSRTPDVVAVQDTNNPGIKVELLFEKDGIKVYRFYDGYRLVYYTDARGNTAWEEQHGKARVPQEVETIK